MFIVCCCRTLINYLTTVSFEKWSHVWFYSPALPSPSSLPMLPLPSSGDGDQEHALPGHRVCQERGDLWWVTPPATQGLSIFKHAVPPSLSTSPPTSAHGKECDALRQWCFWQTRKYQSLVEFTLLLHIHGLNLKGHMTDGYLRTMTLHGPCHVQLVTTVLNMLTLSSCKKMTSLTDKGCLLFAKKNQSALINFCFASKLLYWDV